MAESNHKEEKPRLVIVLGSTSIYKKAAAEKAFHDVYPGHEIDLQLVKAPSEVNSQPVGNEETLLGARNRLKNAKKEKEGQKYDFVVAMENGVFSVLNGKETIWFDIGWIILEDAQGKQSVSFSSGVVFPTRFIFEAEHRGLQLTTVGSVIAEETGADEWNPHKLLTNNILSRPDLLDQALKIAIGQYQKNLV
jgi:inosine/xanthosine triphosphatase